MGRTCPKCGRSVVDTSLRFYAEGKVLCSYCALVSELGAVLLGIGLKSMCDSMNISEDDLKLGLRQNHGLHRLIRAYIQGVAHFGASIPQPPMVPIMAIWSITKRCNLSCPHCCADAEKRSIDKTTFDEACKVVDKLDRAGVVALGITGGEPLCRPDLIQILRYARMRGLILFLATNGTMVSWEKALELRDAGVDYVLISLDGASPHTHDKIRDAPGSYDLAVAGIKNCVEAGLYVNVASVATKLNLEELLDVQEVARSLGAKSFQVLDLIEVGRAARLRHLALSPDERKVLAERLARRWREIVDSGVPFKCSYEWPGFTQVVLEVFDSASKSPFGTVNLPFSPAHVGLARVIREGCIAGSDPYFPFVVGCEAGLYSLYISDRGYVMPCPYLPIRLGDIRNDDIGMIWLQSKVLSEIRNRSRLKGRCSTCKVRDVCGGCRARAFLYLKDHNAHDVGCPF